MLPHHGKEILYVDDEETALKYFAQLFGDDFRIHTLPSGEEAWAYLQENPDRVAVLITDQRMGQVSGVELMERVRTRFPNIVRILITAFTQLEYAVKSVNEGGAFRYLEKPINEQEMIGTLMRACEFHDMTIERERLVREKLSVLHRLVVMDRVRGLATAVTALDGRVRGAWAALVSYMEQSPVKQRIKVQMEEIAELNLLALAKQESQQMIQTVEAVLRDTVAVSSGDSDPVDAGRLAGEVADAMRTEMLEDDLDLEFSADETVTIESDAGMLRRLFETLLRRLSDVQDQPSKIVLKVTATDEGIAIEARGNFRAMNDDQIASLFAAAIPLRKWPIGLDMDLLNAFLITHHLGGRMKIEPEPPSGPGFKVTLPRTIPSELKSALVPAIDPAWFDTIYDSLESWETEITDT